jgi:hypothetical protein
MSAHQRFRVAHGVVGKGISGCQDNGHAGASELIRIYLNISTSELSAEHWHGITILPLYSMYKLLQLHLCGAMVIMCATAYCHPKTYVFVSPI